MTPASDDKRIILAMDSVLSACSVAVMADGQLLAHQRVNGRRGHAERLPGMIQTVLQDAGISQDNLTHYAVTRGPGSFAGIRVALSAARAMALVSGLPIIGVNALQVVAAGIALPDRERIGQQNGKILSLFDARRDQVYAQFFAADQMASPLSEPALWSLTDLTAAIVDQPLMLAGSGVDVLRAILRTQEISPAALLDAQGLSDPETAPDAKDLARLAALLPADAGPVEPLYIRPPDAKLPGGITPGP